MNGFTPISALVGGTLIGTACVLLLWLNGRIAGISGILGGALAGPERLWRWLFLAGLVVGTGVYVGLSHAWGGTPPPAPRQALPVWLLPLAGLLVGYGSALGRGCTSGHGVCGLARLSLRSLVAVPVFLCCAIATTWLVRHVLGLAT
ncbi:YeeE/YedE family protein [Corticibacter populi]|uniref:YeeE/YedE family protein n=1 Tax=Corticibacter populi TaxID=1550736 RepID=A0A3M6QXV6_9BURK|nr:YeeE/YedE family protein [Corticibacter populi]RMX07824.1 YeeE/YedE family protein [Corticibacter populi]RZS35058.1 hypothetical protein EV687_0112 [Corticibacter populi]